MASLLAVVAGFSREPLIKCTSHCAKPSRHFLLKLKSIVVTRCELETLFQISLINGRIALRLYWSGDWIDLFNYDAIYISVLRLETLWRYQLRM